MVPGTFGLSVAQTTPPELADELILLPAYESTLPIFHGDLEITIALGGRLDLGFVG